MALVQDEEEDIAQPVILQDYIYAKNLGIPILKNLQDAPWLYVLELNAVIEAEREYLAQEVNLLKAVANGL